MSDPVAKEVGEIFSRGCAGARSAAGTVLPASMMLSIGMALRSAGQFISNFFSAS